MGLQCPRKPLCRNHLLSLIVAAGVSCALPVLSLAEAGYPESPDFPGFIFWEYDYKEALKTARRQDTFVVAYIYSNDCDRCQKMDKDTFSDPEVIRFSRGLVFLKARLDSDASGALLNKHSIGCVPTVLVLSSSGGEIFRESNHMPPSLFLEEMNRFRQSTPEGPRPEFQDANSLQFCFDYARKAFQHTEFLEATKALDYVLYKDPGNAHGLNDEVLLLFGTSLVYLYQLDAAEVLLARLLVEYPQSPTIPNAMYILGEIYVQTDRVDRGRSLLRDLIEQYPEHAMAGDAKKTLARIEGSRGEAPEDEVLRKPRATRR